MGSGHNVLMTTDAVGGVWHYAIDLSRALSRAGHRVTLAVIGPEPDADQRRTATSIAGVELAATGLPLDWLCDSETEAARTARALAGLAGECGADLVHCNSPALVGAARWPVPVVAVAHGCIATWWEAARDGPLDPALGWHPEMVRRGLIAAAAVIAPSESFAAQLQETYRLPARPLAVHNGRPPVPVAATPPIDAVLTAGRLWDPAKNAALLDRVAGMIDTRLLAAGALDGPNGESIAPTNLVALGPLPGKALAELIARRPVFVSAARFEPFGLAVLEAASAGCALVLSDIPTFRELWDGAAVFADPDDAEGFTAAIARLREEPEWRAQLGREARMRSARYSVQAMGDATMAVHRRVLDAQAKEAAA